MRDFDFQSRINELLTPDVVLLLTKIAEYKGKQELYMQAKKDSLESLLEVAKIQSTESSNKIEGIFTSNARLSKLLKNKTTPQNRNEQEIAGYRDVLSTIHENYEYIPINPSYILQLHQLLYKFSGSSIGGQYKNADNYIEEQDEQGNRFVRFKPVPAWETSEAMSNLCNAYNRAMNEPNINKLLLLPMFILDFLCIHPFNDGNGRLSRLLTLLILYHNDCVVGRYISIEKLIEASKETYYDALQASSTDWHENKNNYLPFTKYMLGVIVSAYREFGSRVETIESVSGSKSGQVRTVAKSFLGKFTKSDIVKKLPNISKITIERTLTQMVKEEEIIKTGKGRYTSYVWNEEAEK